MAKIFFTEEDDPLDIRRDSVFKAVFTRDNPLSKGALSRLVSALIGKDVAIEAITANEPPIDNIRDRQIRYDIKCKANNGELVNIEMSLNPNSFEPIRLEYYAGRLFTGQDIKGVGYKYDDLKQSYQIAILARKRFFPDEVFFHTFEYFDPGNGMSLNGKSRIITLELSKLEKVVEKPAEAMSAKEYWAVFFGYLTDKSRRRKINEIVEKEEGIAMASEALITITQDEREQAWRESRLKYELDTQSMQATIRDEVRLEERRRFIEMLKSGKSPEEIISEYERLGDHDPTPATT